MMDHTSSSSRGTVADSPDLPKIFAALRDPSDDDPPAAPITICTPAEVPAAVAEAQRRRTRYVPPPETIDSFSLDAEANQ